MPTRVCAGAVGTIQTHRSSRIRRTNSRPKNYFSLGQPVSDLLPQNGGVNFRFDATTTGLPQRDGRRFSAAKSPYFPDLSPSPFRLREDSSRAPAATFHRRKLSFRPSAVNFHAWRLRFQAWKLTFHAWKLTFHASALSFRRWNTAIFRWKRPFSTHFINFRPIPVGKTRAGRLVPVGSSRNLKR